MHSRADLVMSVGVGAAAEPTPLVQTIGTCDVIALWRGQREGKEMGLIHVRTYYVELGLACSLRCVCE